MLSRLELDRVAEALSTQICGARVERWVEPERGRLAFSLYRREGGHVSKPVLGLDARSGRAHLGALDRLPTAPAQLPAFAGYLRAHLGRARLEGARIRGDDRQLELAFTAKEGEYRLLLSIFGRRSNLYLLGADDTLLQALLPLAQTRSELRPGEPYRDPEGAAPQCGNDRFAVFEGMALLEEIARHFAQDDAERSHSSLERELAQAFKKERRNAERRVERLEAELAEADDADRLAREGELLKTHLGRVEPGASRVSVEDWEGRSVEIELDPRKNAKQNLEAIFKRYQKLLRRLTKAGGQIESARAALAKIEALEAEAAASSDLETFAEREDVQALRARHASRKQSAAGDGGRRDPDGPKLPAAYRDLPRKLHPRRYLSLDGLEIWVGRSDEGNDVLTTRLARGNDLFFHLDGAPGSHVVLRTEGAGDPPPESVLDACELAVQFSKHKKASHADVHVAPIKHVKKPRGAKRGLVYVTGGKSIRLRREESRLERLLQAKLPD